MHKVCYKIQIIIKIDTFSEDNLSIQPAVWFFIPINDIFPACHGHCLITDQAVNKLKIILRNTFNLI